jgi:hypothetical protein
MSDLIPENFDCEMIEFTQDALNYVGDDKAYPNYLKDLRERAMMQQYLELNELIVHGNNQK